MTTRAIPKWVNVNEIYSRTTGFEAVVGSIILNILTDITLYAWVKTMQKKLNILFCAHSKYEYILKSTFDDKKCLCRSYNCFKLN